VLAQQLVHLILGRILVAQELQDHRGLVQLADPAVEDRILTPVDLLQLHKPLDGEHSDLAPV